MEIQTDRTMGKPSKKSGATPYMLFLVIILLGIMSYFGWEFKKSMSLYMHLITIEVKEIRKDVDLLSQSLSAKDASVDKINSKLNKLDTSIDSLGDMFSNIPMMNGGDMQEYQKSMENSMKKMNPMKMGEISNPMEMNEMGNPMDEMKKMSPMEMNEMGNPMQEMNKMNPMKMF